MRSVVYAEFDSIEKKAIKNDLFFAFIEAERSEGVAGTEVPLFVYIIERSKLR